MTISIIMPVHNTGEYLAECLESIFLQTFTDYELICVDDASDDLRTIEVLNEYENKDKRMRVIRLKKHLGAAKARNIGFEEALGEFTVFLDSDDVFSINFLEQMYLKISKEKAEVCVCGHTKFSISAEGSYKNRDFYTPSKKKLQNNSWESWLIYISMVPWDKLCRTDYLRSNHIGFQDLTSCNDVFWSCMVMKCTEKVSVIEDVDLVRHRINTSTQISANRDSMNLYYVIKLLLEQNKGNILFQRQCKALLLAAMISEIDRCRIEIRNEQLYENVKKLFEGEAIQFQNKLLQKCKENVVSLPYSSCWYKKMSSIEGRLISLKEEIREEMKKFNRIFLWGMGKRGQAFQKFCKNENVKLCGVTDSKNEKVGLVTEYGYSVMHTDEVMNESEGIVIVCNLEIYQFLLLKDIKLQIINLEEYIF